MVDFKMGDQLPLDEDSKETPIAHSSGKKSRRAGSRVITPEQWNWLYDLSYEMLEKSRLQNVDLARETALTTLEYLN